MAVKCFMMLKQPIPWDYYVLSFAYAEIESDRSENRKYNVKESMRERKKSENESQEQNALVHQIMNPVFTMACNNLLTKKKNKTGETLKSFAYLFFLHHFFSTDTIQLHLNCLVYVMQSTYISICLHDFISVYFFMSVMLKRKLKF